MTWGAKFGPRILSLTPVSYGLTLCKCCFHKSKDKYLGFTGYFHPAANSSPSLCRETKFNEELTWTAKIFDWVQVQCAFGSLVLCRVNTLRHFCFGQVVWHRGLCGHHTAERPHNILTLRKPALANLRITSRLMECMAHLGALAWSAECHLAHLLQQICCSVVCHTQPVALPTCPQICPDPAIQLMNSCSVHLPEAQIFTSTTIRNQGQCGFSSVRSWCKYCFEWTLLRAKSFLISLKRHRLSKTLLTGSNAPLYTFIGFYL